MNKCALVIPNEYEYNNLFASVLKKLGNIIDLHVKNRPCKHEVVEIEKGNLLLYIIKLECQKKSDEEVTENIIKITKWMENEEISIVAFDDLVYNKYNSWIINLYKNSIIKLCKGKNTYFSMLLPSLKKVLKSKGLDINQIDVVVVPGLSYDDEEKFIKYLSPYIKYLTYISKNDYDVRHIVQWVYDSTGVSIRICENIKHSISNNGLIINLSSEKIDLRMFEKQQRIILYDPRNTYDVINDNISIMRDMKIDISSIYKDTIGLNDNCILKLSEMFILNLLNKNELVSRDANEHEIKGIYKCFKDNSLRINGMVGINL